MPVHSFYSNLKLGVLILLCCALVISMKFDAATAGPSGPVYQEPQQPPPEKPAEPKPGEAEKPQEPEQEQEKPAQQPGGAAAYAGPETCMGCHEDIYKQYAATAHHLTETSSRYKAAEKGCEACHGPGQEHADAGGDTSLIFNPKGKPAQIANARCLTCHGKKKEFHNFRQSEHGLNKLACADCHSPHQPKPVKALLKTEATQLCYKCHGNVRQQFNRPYRHRVHEKGMKCNDCHNPHGGYNLAQTRSASGGTDPVCFKCHTDKQGPFAFEHASVRLEGCLICHTSHGSNNPKMLKRSVVKQLCLECHSVTPGIPSGSPPAFHDLRNPQYRNCTICHLAVHGSNVSPALLQ
jgi:DmsE family decaheme c-type cytochrome